MSIRDLFNACHYHDSTGKLDKIRHLISIVPNIDEKIYGMTMLENVIGYPKTEFYIEIAKMLIEAGANPNYLSEAVKHKSDAMIELLLSSGADPSIVDRYGYKAIHRAYSKKILKLLVEYGADVEAKDRYGRNILHRACENNNIEVVRCLLNECGANPNAKDNAGNLPESSRSQESHDEITVLLRMFR